MNPNGPIYDVQRFRRNTLSYARAENDRSFYHNYNRDLHLFVIWQGARHKTDEILSDLETSFLIRSAAVIQWSNEYRSENSNRLYKKAHTGSTGIPPKVGDGQLVAIVVEDPDPVYAFDRTVSGLIECVNIRVVSHKRRYRSWFESAYAVHSTNSLGEFFEQAPFLLGIDGVEEAMSTRVKTVDLERRTCDLAGAGGWSSFHELFSYLALGTNSIVLRSFEHLPDLDPALEDEIDILCQDLPGFVAAANAYVPDPILRPHKCVVDVAGHQIRFDARHVGDGYYDAVWETDLLHRQTIHHGIVGRPRPDDYFFSLLYHAKLQKTEVSPKYIEKLPRLAASIGLTWVSSEDVVSDESSGAILTAYMKANGYRYAVPLDRKVTNNRLFMRQLRDVMPPRSYFWRRVSEKTLRLLSRITPVPLKDLIPRPWKARLAKVLRP